MTRENARKDLPHSIELVATGHASPGVVDNDGYFQRCKWPEPAAREALEAETGVRSRRWCHSEETALDMMKSAVASAFAGKEALKEEIDVVLVTSSTTTAVLRPADPDDPGSGDMAPLVMRAIGRNRILSLDLKACNCTGFLRALQVMDGLLCNPNYRAGLIVSVERTSQFALEPTNRSAFTFILSDGAGAAVVRRRPRADRVGVVDYVGHVEVDKLEMLRWEADGRHIESRGNTLKEAVIAALLDTGKGLLERNGIRPSDVDWLLPIQTSAGIVSPVLEGLGFPREKLLWFGDRTGFCGSASIPSTLSEQIANGKIRKGDLILSVAVGAGLNAGATLYYY